MPSVHDLGSNVEAARTLDNKIDSLQEKIKLYGHVATPLPLSPNYPPNYLQQSFGLFKLCNTVDTSYIIEPIGPLSLMLASIGAVFVLNSIHMGVLLGLKDPWNGGKWHR